MTAPTPERRVGEEDGTPTANEIAAFQSFLDEMRAVVIPEVAAAVEFRAALADTVRRRWVPRSDLATEQAMHSAWRKRAEEAETANARLTAEVERLKKAVYWAYHEGLTDAVGAAQQGGKWDESAAQRDVVRADAALSLPTPAPEATE